jgi:hypothetical protein
MANEEKTNANENKSQDNNKPERDANPNSQKMPEDATNEANYKGAVDLGTDGTKPTASQQQGQGSWNAKDNDGDNNQDSKNKA